MTWTKTPEQRARDAQVYGNPEYRRNKAVVRRRSGGKCEFVEGGIRCSSTDRVECDHTVPVSQGGTHKVSNLRDLCKTHHNVKTATEGGGRRSPSDPSPTPRTRW